MSGETHTAEHAQHEAAKALHAHQQHAVAAGETAASEAEPLVAFKEVKYHFKGEKIRDPNDKTKILEEKPARPKVTLMLPMPTFHGLVEALKSEKQREYILSLIGDAVIAAAKDQVAPSDESLKPINKQEELDLSKLTFEYLANVTPTERRGRGLPKESWEEFEQNYIAVMPQATGKSAEAVGNAAKLFKLKLQPCKTNKPVLALLKQQLDIWFSSAGDAAEEFAEHYEFLTQKLDTFLNTTDEQLMANL